jgi:hypothetical protein
MFLFSYDISGKEDPHGIRVRLNYLLKKAQAISILQSLWICSEDMLELPKFHQLQRELKQNGFPFIISPLSSFQSHPVPLTDPDFVLGIVLHGARVIEQGIVREVLALCHQENITTRVVIGGTLARIAAMDANLDELIHPLNLKPSQAVDFLLSHNADVVVLLNHGRSVESGFTLGAQIFANSKLAPYYRAVPILQVDLLHTPQAMCIPWNLGAGVVNEWLAKRLNCQNIDPRQLESKFIPWYNNESGEVTRIVRGVEKGDWLMIRGRIVGRVTSDTVSLRTTGGIIDTAGSRGVDFLPHGLEKLGIVDLKNDRITAAPFLSPAKLTPGRNVVRNSMRRASILRSAESLYSKVSKTDTFISIGDDTTYLLYQMLGRFSGKKLIGIVDLDSEFNPNKILQDAFPQLPPKFEIIQVRSGYDDIAGNAIDGAVFKGKKNVSYQKFEDFRGQVEDAVKTWHVQTLRGHNKL